MLVLLDTVVCVYQLNASADIFHKSSNKEACLQIDYNYSSTTNTKKKSFNNRKRELNLYLPH